MSWIFLSFAEHLDQSASGKNSKNEFFQDSLNEQFQQLKKRVPEDRRPFYFQNFINQCFPNGVEKRYYFSCPNFKREKNGNDYVSYLNNVVIIPELTNAMRSTLPDHQNIMLIGDIREGGKLKCFVVKGMQFIDENMHSKHDIALSGKATFSFEKGNWSERDVEYDETIFTEDMIANLIENCWTVSDPTSVRKVYDEWVRYIEFRKYYLEEQSNRSFELNDVEYIEAYAVNKKEYKKNSTFYDDVLLDDHKEFKNAEMVVLSKKIYDAVDYPLIRLNIDRNKRDFLNASVKKGNKYVNEEEKKIKTLSRDNVFITASNPSRLKDSEIKNKDRVFRELLQDGYELGDRFKIIPHDVLPLQHLNQLEYDADRLLNIELRDIDAKYKAIIETEIRDYDYKEALSLNEELHNEVDSLKKQLEDSLLDDVNKNEDKNILKLIKEEQEKIKKEVNKSIKREKDEKESDYYKRVNDLTNERISYIDIKSYYEDRNKKTVEDFKNKKINEYKNKLAKLKADKLKELDNVYAEKIRSEKAEITETIKAKLHEDIEYVKDRETILRYSIYFNINDINAKPSEKQINKIKECHYIVYDSRAERAKIRRQEQALDNFFNGYVKNPYLSTYLFSPQDLEKAEADRADWRWHLESLNEKQKEAVRKAVYSNGIFLLQGPPGTGKTQVIAETVAQLVKKGKKVLISSETHKAIDNVFERLPKIAEIVPIRLIPSFNDKGKDNDYDPMYLVDNFYLNISANMKKAINRYENFQQNKTEFDEKFEKLKLDKAKLDKNIQILKKAEDDIKELDKQAKEINEIINDYNDNSSLISIELDKLRRTKRHIDKDNLKLEEDIDNNIISDYYNALGQLFSDSEIYNTSNLEELVKTIDTITPQQISREVAIINPKSKSVEIKQNKDALKAQMAACKNELDEIIPGKENEYAECKQKLLELVNLENDTGEKIDTDNKLNKIFVFEYLVKNLSIIPETLLSLKQSISERKTSFYEILDKKISGLNDKNDEISDEILKRRKIVRDINSQIEDIEDRDDVREIDRIKDQLETSISKFFKDFEISEPYRNIDEAIDVISDKWKELEENFAAKEQENKEKIPMYSKIAKYISSEDVIETDRKEYTKDLFESANVFGMTCTSRDRYKKESMKGMADYNIEDLDIKKVGIDVVIIDEVSKSSFLDLLIPILYGKTVILVGDHRQLPPMYEFAKLREEDFEGLDENYINSTLNKKYTQLYEECFFKTLFEKIPDDYKTMLQQQYRCHEHIMQVFNHFYQGNLRLGFEGQNNEKKHNIKLNLNGRSIISPDKHIYFVNCKTFETREDDSTSMFNMGEARVVVELIKKMNEFFKNNPDKEKLSIGVISTYGDQAGRIKNLMKSEKVKTNGFNTKEEKMIVSTVDDFQGDERDIIILTTVRNPEHPEKSNPGFITAYQRINVALSRARRLLIIVGNRKYLEDKGVIDLPDVNGDHRKDHPHFRVYEEILGTIETYGKVIQDVDILEDKEVKIDG